MTLTPASSHSGSGGGVDPLAPYVPTWTASSINPAIGDGVLEGYYTVAGDVVICTILCRAGGTTTVGNGVYAWSLPVDAADGVNAVLGVGNGLNTGVAHAPLTALALTADTVGLLRDSNAAQVTHAAPFAFANGDQYSLSLIYRGV